MESYKREFIKFLEDAGVLKFGDFTAKSGRKIPYFFELLKIHPIFPPLHPFREISYFFRICPILQYSDQ